MVNNSLFLLVKRWLAGLLFRLAGKLDASYDVWLDDAPSRRGGQQELRWCDECRRDTPHQKDPDSENWWCLR